MTTSFTRREFILQAAGTALALNNFGVPDKTGDLLQGLREERKKLAHRRRRIIFNNDGDDQNDPGADTPAGLLKVRTTALLDSQVDSICYSTGNGLKLLLRDGPFSRLYRCPDPSEYGTANKNLAKLVANFGKDALEVMIDVCRNRGMEIFYSNRMNSNESSFHGDLYDINLKHPEYMLSTSTQGEARKMFPDVRSFWADWNFELPVIRKMTVDALREVCQSYDIDGIELQFVRDPLYFRSTMEGKPTTPGQTALMTELVREIRRMTEEEGLKRGRPILVQALCPMSSALSRSVGLDVETWLQEALIDILIVGRFANVTVPMKGMIDLGHRYGVPVYPWVANYAYKNHQGEFEANEQDWKMYRGDVLFRYWEGADGMYMYNVFDPTSPLWRELGDPKQLLGMDRSYVWDYLPSWRNLSNLLWEVHLASIKHRPVVPVSDGGSEPIPLMLGEEPGQGAGGEAHDTTWKLRLHVTGLTSARGFAVKVNDRALGEAKENPDSGGKGSGLWLEFSVAEKLFHAGENLVEASLGEQCERSVTLPRIDQVRLDVKAVRKDTEHPRSET